VFPDEIDEMVTGVFLFFKIQQVSFLIDFFIVMSKFEIYFLARTNFLFECTLIFF